MDFAARASQIGQQFKVEVFDPVVNVVAASPRNDDLLGSGCVADVSHCLGQVAADVGHIGEGWIFIGCPTVPGFDTP